MDLVFFSRGLDAPIWVISDVRLFLLLAETSSLDPWYTLYFVSYSGVCGKMRNQRYQVSVGDRTALFVSFWTAGYMSYPMNNANSLCCSTPITQACGWLFGLCISTSCIFLALIILPTSPTLLPPFVSPTSYPCAMIDFLARLSIQGGWTPLHFAAQGGHLECVELLLSKRARVSCVTKVREHGTHVLHRLSHY